MTRAKATKAKQPEKKLGPLYKTTVVFWGKKPMPQHPFNVAVQDNVESYHQVALFKNEKVAEPHLDPHPPKEAWALEDDDDEGGEEDDDLFD